MSSSSDLLRYQIEFTVWANKRMLNAATNLMPDELAHDFKTSDKSILGTLVHMYRAERVWIARIEGNPVDFVAPADDTMPALAENWPILTQRWTHFAAGNPDPAAELTYLDLRKNEWTQPIWKILLHVANHSTHHRGQISGFIRALGHTPPNVDFITFARGL